jgi:monoamine oxidase
MARYAVIGAGAAGISAARDLQRGGHEVVVFEARDRPGGRAWTDYSLAPHGVELGAEFIHGDNVSTWDWVREFEAPTTGEAHRYEMWFHLAGKLLATPEARQHFGAEAVFALGRLTERWQSAGREEATVDRIFELWPEISDKPLNADGRALIENYAAMMTASDVSTLGTHSYDASRPVNRGLENWRLLDGYTRLMQQAAAGLDIRYRAAVRRIRWDDTSVAVTAGGAEERFDGGVVTLPLGVLKRGTVEFDPPLPPAKQDAIQRLNAGSISKVVLKFDRVYWPENLTFIFTHLDTQLWWRPGQGQAREEPVITAFFGGSAAAALEQVTQEEAAEHAVAQLSDVLGESLGGKLVDSRYKPWGADEYTLMGYSSMPPGGAGLREALAAPAGALHFAGEAASLTHAATVDGAIDSGRVAASELMALAAMPS